VFARESTEARWKKLTRWL